MNTMFGRRGSAPAKLNPERDHNAAARHNITIDFIEASLVSRACDRDPRTGDYSRRQMPRLASRHGENMTPISRKPANLQAAFAMFAAYDNYCWQTRKPGKSGAKRPTAAMMAGLAGHVWSFAELFNTVLR